MRLLKNLQRTIAMQVESTKYNILEFLGDWQTDLRDVDRRKKPTLTQQCRRGDPILIDYGSDTIKAGFPSSVSPEMIMKPLTAKSKQAVSTTFTNTVNFSYDQIDLLKSSHRSLYERNIIQHFSLLEHCTDFVFSSLGCSDDTVRNPIVISEPPANPIYCRSQTAEMFFECYGIQELFVGCDPLFAYFHELDCDMPDFSKQSCLLISFGASSTHIIPIISGKTDYQSIKRLNLGSNNCLQILSKLLTLKNPQLRPQLTLPVMKHIFNKLSRVAEDYKQQLLYFASEGQPRHSFGYKNRIEEGNKGYESAVPFPPVEISFERPGLETSLEEIRRREEIKKRMSERLKEALQKKREEKQRIYRAEYDELLKLKDKYQADPENAKDDVAELFGEDSPEDAMRRRIKLLQAKLDIENKDQDKKFALIDIPDSELPPQKQRLKKLQIYQKAALQQRRKKKQQQQQQQRKLRQLRQDNPQKYTQQLHARYNALAAKMKQVQRIKSDLANRNSRLNQRRMQTLAQLAQDNDQQDNFGDNQQDWLLYKGYEQQDHRSQMQAIEVQLREIDPSWMVNTDRHHLNTGFTLHLASELVRPCEIYFQPYMAGNDQMSLPDIVALVLRNYTPDMRRVLLGNVRLVGGGCAVPGIRERLLKELTALAEVGTQIHIEVAREPRLGCFYGMRGLVNKYPEYVKQNSIRRIDFLHGNIGTKEHLFGRLHF